eukprot:snap_masked-scaffold_20-processed-gene-1.12-mRNA-1 protein AED:1.00 eAED:1.00 QI:0/-1/0/0/-1/1/1/0/496
MQSNYSFISGQDLGNSSVSSANPRHKKSRKKKKKTYLVKESTFLMERTRNSQKPMQQKRRSVLRKKTKNSFKPSDNQKESLDSRRGSALRASVSRNFEAHKQSKISQQCSRSQLPGPKSARKSIESIVFGTLSKLSRKGSALGILDDSDISLTERTYRGGAESKLMSVSSITSLRFKKNTEEIRATGIGSRSMSIGSIASFGFKKNGETNNFVTRSVQRYNVEKKKSKWKDSTRLSRLKRQSRITMDNVYLFSSFNRHKVCEKCNDLIKTPMLMTLFAGNTVLGENKSATVSLRYSRKTRKFASSKGKEVELIWSGGKIEIYSHSRLYASLYMSDICNIELGPEDIGSVLVSTFYTLEGSKKSSGLRRDQFYLTFSSKEETEEWIELLLHGLKSMVLVYDGTVSSMKDKVHWLNREHEECLLKKKARALDLCLPVGDEAIIQAYRDIVSYLLLIRKHDEATTFMDKVDELQTANTPNNDPLNVIKQRLFWPDVADL